MLLNKVQSEFEKLPETKMTLSDEDKTKLSPADQEIKLKQLKDRTLGNIKFIGELFLRRLLSAKAVKEVVTSLIGADASYCPEELFIECLCELITTIGWKLDSTDAGKSLLTVFSRRMRELKAKDRYSERIKSTLQDVLDLRQNGRRQKVHKEKAKALRDARKDLSTHFTHTHTICLSKRLTQTTHTLRPSCTSSARWLHTLPEQTKTWRTLRTLSRCLHGDTKKGDLSAERTTLCARGALTEPLLVLREEP
mmetsp:Transcript_4605/g.12260  ORF Transcript_4605/g.12260 Transcript_4605/m.12260 type:complete len:252 (+) Transcript_4605:1417-2172(+)